MLGTSLSKIESEQNKGKSRGKKRLDFAVLYANPLVVKTTNSNGQVMTSVMKNDPVDYAGEVNTILKILSSTKKEMQARIECATGDHLAKFLKERPKVLHISCHGDYDKDKEEFFLEFENHKAELYKLTPSVIRTLFKGEDLEQIDIIFVNACHSESVAKTFL